MSDDNSDDNSSKNDDLDQTARGEQPTPATPAGIVLQPGQRLLKNGAVYDHNVGKIVANNPDLNPHAITKETTQHYHELKRERVQAAVQQGIIAGADRRTIDASIGAITEAQTHIALNEMAGRASTEAARFVFQVAGFMPDRKPEISAPLEALGIGFARELCRILQDNGGFIAENDIIDGEIVGNGNDDAPGSG